VRCAICCNENAETNYYCGLCGAALRAVKQRPVQPPVPSPAAPAPALRPAPPAAPPVRRQTAPPLRTGMPGPDRISADSPREQNSAPIITGPSFLGLNAPAPRSGPRDSARDNSLSPGSQGQDHLQHSSQSLDYLLEDDEEQPKGGWGKLIVVLIALLLALGFGYLRWRQGGFDWLTGNKNPAAVASATPTPQASSGDSTSTLPSLTPNATSDATGAPAATTPGQASPTGVDSSTPGTAPSSGLATTPMESAAPQTSPPQTNSAQTQNSPAQTSSDSRPTDSNPSADSAPSSPAQTSDTDSETRPSQAKALKPRQPKPSPAKPIDTVTEAERYIYGRGTRQDCDRGLRLLKPAADQNPKAMVSLGVLYTTGTCTPRDLPTAYRWFALALHKQPDNQALQDDLQKLWSQMTPPERQLAIKLSQ